MRRIEHRRENYIPADATELVDAQSDAVVYTVERPGRFVVMGFAGRAQKPAFHEYYRAPEHRQRRIDDFFKGRRSRIEAKAVRNRPHSLEVGHILVSSWGYDQTNIDFYEVTKIVGPHTVEVRPIKQVVTEATGWGCGKVMPLIGEYSGDARRHRVSENSIKLTSFSWASVWDGRPKSYSSGC